jgi:Lrp/AsnC family transcriptional regulator, leucine-responsive regulatory protein
MKQVRERHNMDEIDYRILKALRLNARLSNIELAERVGLSASPCWNRLRRLEEQGIIKNYVAIYDQNALGMPDTVMVEVTLERHDDEVIRRFEKGLSQLPEVIEAYLLTGDHDFLLKVAIAGTEEYERFLRERLYKIPGIRQTRSSFTLRCLKQTFSVEPQLPKC